MLSRYQRSIGVVSCVYPGFVTAVDVRSGELGALRDADLRVEEIMVNNALPRATPS